jgi:gag-polyprotein putative aspartyl protease
LIRSTKTATASSTSTDNRLDTLDFLLIRSNLNEGQIYHSVLLQGRRRNVKVRALVDCGASTLFISPRLVKREKIPTKPLKKSIELRNVDLSPNKIGRVTHKVECGLKVNRHHTNETLLVAEIGEDDVIIGVDWLRRHNPDIDWRKGTIRMDRCPDDCPVTRKEKPLKTGKKDLVARTTLQEEEEDPPEEIPDLEEDVEQEKIDLKKHLTPKQIDEWFPDTGIEYTEVEKEQVLDHIIKWKSIEWGGKDQKTERIAAGRTWSQAIAEKTAIKEGEKTFEELVPREFRNFKDVFSKKASERLPTRKPYDHEIKLEEGKPLPYSRVYAMAPKEREALQEYLDENLAKGYICKSKLQTASPVFFIKKKEGTLCLISDYRKLNAITVKDRYPLPLTQGLLDRFASARMFTTLDLRWGYNNIRIKEGDEHKAAFITEKGLFEPLVMGFGLCNAPATFQ